jgi:small subunit ribosomal protein S20
MAKLKTGRHTSSLKENRKMIKRNVRNTALRSRITNISSKVELAVEKKDAALAKTLLNEAFSEWDKAKAKKLIHTNAARNAKARLSKLVHSLAKA